MTAGRLNFPEPPSAPTNLVLKSVSAHAVCVAWQPPEHDGGAPVKHYVVELKPPDETEFEPVARVKGLACEVNCLSEGRDYELRVKAVNPGGGSGEYAQLDYPVTPKLPFGIQSPVHASSVSIDAHFLKLIVEKFTFELIFSCITRLDCDTWKGPKLTHLHLKKNTGALQYKNSNAGSHTRRSGTVKQ